jgi:DNA polymerase-3 subunit delta
MGMAMQREAKMIYVFWGKDEFSIEEAVQKIKNSLGEISLLSTNMNLLDGQKLTLNELKAVGEAMPFLADRRLVIVRGLLERFELKDKLGRPIKNNGSGAKQSESQLLADCIRGFPDSTILVLIDVIEPKKNSLQNNPLFQAIAGEAEIRSFPVMQGSQLSQWIESRVNQSGGSISHQATNVLIGVIGGDLHTMSNEIDKLVAFTGGRLIEEKDIRAVVSASQEADIFAMVDAIMDRKAGAAEQILQKLLQNGRVPQEILALLARQVQMLVQIKDLKSQKKPAFEIQSRLGIKSPFAWNKMSARAGKYTLDSLKEIYRSLLETDLAIKTGKFDGDLALNILVADLCERLP